MAEHSEVSIEEVNPPLQVSQEKDGILANTSQEIEKTPVDVSAAKNLVQDMQDGRSKFDRFIERNAIENRLVDNAIGGALLGVFEFAREWGTGRAFVDGLEALKVPVWMQKNLQQMDKIIPLENFGNLAESHWVAATVYYGISLIDSGVSRLTQKPLAERAKVGIAWLASVGVNIAMETGIMREGTPDLKDIPAGVIGATIFAGIMLINRELIQSLNESIKNIKGLIFQEKQDKNGLTETENLAYALATVPENPGAPDEFDEQLE